MRVFLGSILFFLAGIVCQGQEYTKQDSLRGTITPEREWWNLSYYHINISVDIDEKTIQGSNTIRYKVLKPAQVIQVDLQSPMNILKVSQDGEELTYSRNGNFYFIKLKKNQIIDDYNEIIVEYSGKPRIAPRPPWDSGMVWEKDNLGKPFVSSISWGAGSSQWWPCKDHMYDEVDSVKLSINVRNDLVAVANGKLRSVLVSVQFLISIILIIGTMVMYRQLQYMINKDLGFNNLQSWKLREFFRSISWRERTFKM